MRLQVQHLQRIAQNNPDDLPDKMNQLANTLIQQIDSLSRIATEFSNFAKMPKPTLAPTDVDQVCSNSISLYSQDQAYISYKIGPGNKNVMADPEQLGRVLTNLIQNAIQAIPDDREPRIEVETLLVEEGRAIIRVTDNGSGIPEAEQEKIFEPNFTTKSSGMGLGLAIVKGIIHGFNGDIVFVSDTHYGTTFTVSIPTISQN
jgi:signal transduction histidine kinase